MDPNSNGSVRLVEAVVYHAVMGHYSYKNPERFAERLEGLADSPLLQHYCDAMGYDVDRFRDKILDKAKEIRLNLEK